MSDELLQSYNLDWFAFDRPGKVLHFANGGRGALPEVFKKDLLFYKNVFEFFERLDASVETILIRENLRFIGDENAKKYVSSFMEMASKGVYSYDYFEGSYKVIAMPKDGGLDKFPTMPKTFQ